MTARDAHMKLSDHEPGTFLVRISASGGYSISVVSTRSSIRHYKVRRVVTFGRNYDTFSVDFWLDKDGESNSFFALESCVRRQSSFLKEYAADLPTCHPGPLISFPYFAYL
jgi:hypothetical protein